VSLLASALAGLLLAPTQDLERALGYQESGRFEKAASSYRGLLAKDPDSVTARLYLAEALWLSGNREEAREELSRVRQRAPAILFPLVLLARIDGTESEELVRRIPDARMRAKLLDDSFIEGETIVPIERAAIVLASMGAIDPALAEYRAAAEADPGNLDLHRHLGAFFFKASRDVEAVEAFERAVAIEPSDASSWGQLGSSRLRLQWWDEAIEALEKARSLSGDQPGGLLALGYAYERKPDFEKAVDFYRRAAALSPSWAQPHYRMGRTFIKLDRREEAERELKRAIELDSKLAEARSFLGALYLENRDLVSATRELELAVSLSPRYAKAHFYLAQAYSRAGRAEEAKAELASHERITRESGEVDPN
jgi:tetratricopeptide (TPR) repeat protein